MQTVLETRVKGVNKANAFANELWPRLVAVFAPFVGQKIEKVDGPLLAKIQKLVDALNLPNGDIHVYRHVSNYSLAYTVKTCECTNGIAHYFEQTLYIGKMNNGVLVELKELEPFKTDYTAENVLKAREAYKVAKEAADKAQSALYPFGEYDR
jgi:hypothetical protein